MADITLQAVGVGSPVTFKSTAVSGNGIVTGEISISGKINVGGGGSAPFEGQYEYTPTQATQVVPIEGLRALQDIIINPIPQNYGLITWNGSVLTVS